MRSDRTSLLVRFSGSTFVAALVISLTCGSPAGVVAQEVEVLTPSAQTIVGPEGTLGTTTTENELPETGVTSYDEPSTLTASPPALSDAAANMSSAENADGETASIAENQAPSIPQSEHQPLAVVSNDEPSFLTATAEESGENGPALFDADANMTWVENAEPPTVSIAESRELQIGHSPEDPFVNDSTHITQSEALASPPITEIVRASNYEPWARTPDPSSSPDDAEPVAPIIVTDQATDSAEAPIEIIMNFREESPSEASPGSTETIPPRPDSRADLNPPVSGGLISARPK
jgi:hypothetical protein